MIVKKFNLEDFQSYKQKKEQAETQGNQTPDQAAQHSGKLVRPFKEIKAAGLKEYYHFFVSSIGKTPITEYTLATNPEWIAMNNTTYKFMADHSVDQGSIEVNQFIKKMLIPGKQ